MTNIIIKQTLLEKYPEIAAEWSINNIKQPSDYSYGSCKTVLWTCKNCNHEWKTRIAHRTGPAKSGCPRCFRKKNGIRTATPVPGQTLADLYPNLTLEWSDKNKNTPQSYRYASREKVWWKCSFCHKEWKDSIGHRTVSNRGCPSCKRSHGERVIELFLSNNHIIYYPECKIEGCKLKQSLKFDFVIIYNNKLAAIEYNGEQHYKLGRGYFNNIQNFTQIQIRDKIKKDFCSNKNIPYLIISYLQFNHIEILINQFLKSL